MQIYTRSKTVFNRMMKDNNITLDNIEERDAIFISINSSYGEPPSYFNEERDNLKIMTFDDIDRPMNVGIIGEESHRKLVLFDEKMANELIDFIDKNKDKKYCIIHCTAGVCRSGAVGCFISDYLGQPYVEFREANPHIQPNWYVRKILMDEVDKRKLNKLKENGSN